MMNKYSKLFIAVLMIVFLFGFASAVAYTVSPSAITFTPATNNSTFTISNSNSSTLLNVNVPSQLQITGENGYIAVFSISGTQTNINYSSIFTVTPQNVDFSRFSLEKTYSADIIISEVGSSTNNKTVKVELNRQFCEAGIRGDLEVDIDVTNNGDLGDEDNFYPFEEIEVEVTVDNNGNNDIDDVIVSWGLYNKRTGEFIIDDEEKSVDINNDDQETVTFTFTIDPADLDADDTRDDFALIVKAFSDDEGEENQCDFFRKDVTVARDDHLLIVGDIEIPSEVQCGETITARAKVWNIGDDDERDTYMIVSNSKLGLNKRIDVGDLDILEDKRLSFDIILPKNLTDKSYTIEFKTYNKDDDIFENDDGDESISRETITIADGTCDLPKSVNLIVVLSEDSSSKAGSDLIVKATLRNTGSSDTIYQIEPTGYESWASLKNIQPTSLSLKAGESKDVLITLLPNTDVEGAQEFTVKATYAGGEATKRLVAEIEPSSGGFGLTGFSISNLASGSGFIWAIALINVILVIIIIVIAVRIARK